MLQKRLVPAFLFFLVILHPAAAGEENGRYRAIVLHSAGTSGGNGALNPKVFILDTRDGHLWTWEQNARIRRPAGGARSFGNLLIYQGRLSVGSRPGEVVGKTP